MTGRQQAHSNKKYKVRMYTHKSFESYGHSNTHVLLPWQQKANYSESNKKQEVASFHAACQVLWMTNAHSASFFFTSILYVFQCHSRSLTHGLFSLSMLLITHITLYKSSVFHREGGFLLSKSTLFFMSLSFCTVEVNVWSCFHMIRPQSRAIFYGWSNDAKTEETVRLHTKLVKKNTESNWVQILWTLTQRLTAWW